MLTFNQIKKNLATLDRQGVELLAKKTGVSINTLLKVWNGATPNPRILTVEKLSAYFESVEKKKRTKKL